MVAVPVGTQYIGEAVQSKADCGIIYGLECDLIIAFINTPYSYWLVGKIEIKNVFF